MCVRILQSASQVNSEEWQFFLKGGQVLDRSQQPANPGPAWISDLAWDSITELDHLPNFKVCCTPVVDVTQHGLLLVVACLSLHELQHVLRIQKLKELYLSGTAQHKHFARHVRRMHAQHVTCCISLLACLRQLLHNSSMRIANCDCRESWAALRHQLMPGRGGTEPMSQKAVRCLESGKPSAASCSAWCSSDV